MKIITHCSIGGVGVREDSEKLQSGVHVVVGTPGRVFDMINRGSLRVDKLKMFVLDEADEMLSRGFKDQIYEIFQVYIIFTLSFYRLRSKLCFCPLPCLLKFSK